MYAKSLMDRGYHVDVIRIGKAARLLPLIEAADAVVIWRAGWSEVIREVVDTVRRKRRKLIFDLDDLVMDPSIAKYEFVDGLRTNAFEEKDAASYYEKIQKTLRASDFCTASTEFLASAIRRFGKAAFVLPNGFDQRTYCDMRIALEKWRGSASDGLIRIGYAAGSRTHQKDFVRAAPAVARILREHPHCRLVVFQKDSVDEALRCLDLTEYPEFAGIEEQVEWRLMAPFRQLPDELVRFDINLAPVETGNVFCEAKSELKYFEAALAGIPTIASPTDPFARAIRNGDTGFLAGNVEEWHACLERLVTEPELRRQMGHAAFFDVIWKYGPELRAELADGVMDRVFGAGDFARQAP
jgi:glycosyltransferase involved in cell wall biosynthesis